MEPSHVCQKTLSSCGLFEVPSASKFSLLVQRCPPIGFPFEEVINHDPGHPQAPHTTISPPGGSKMPSPVACPPPLGFALDPTGAQRIRILGIAKQPRGAGKSKKPRRCLGPSSRKHSWRDSVALGRLSLLLPCPPSSHPEGAVPSVNAGRFTVRLFFSAPTLFEHIPTPGCCPPETVLEGVFSLILS